MFKVYYSLIVLICLVIVRTSTQQLPMSPCPRILAYQNDGMEWFGLIDIQYPEFDEKVTLSLTLNVTFSINVKLPTSYIGRIELLEDKSKIVQNLKRGSNIKYKVHFPLLDYLPVVTSIVFNGKEVCRGYADISEISIYLYHKYNTDIIPDHPIEEQPLNFNINDYEANSKVKPSKFGESSRFDEHTESFPRGTSIVSGAPNNIRNTEYERPNPGTSARIPNFQKNPPFNIQKNDFQGGCGETKTPLNGLILKGELTKHGDWPWLIALFEVKFSQSNFICGGSLVRNNLVVTAAHCVKAGKSTVRKDEFLIKLGAFNLNNWFEGDAEIREVNDIIVHPSYGGNTEYNHDIALLRFNPVLFTEYIKPVCLWSGNDDLSIIVGSLGTVIGWGKDENGMVTSEPHLTKVPIVSTEFCRGTRKDYYSFTSNTTMCAGNKDGSGPCNGDSGGGMYIYDNEHSHWVLRGIVSTSLKNPNSKISCNLNEFIIYTDSAKYVRWIQSYL